MLFSEVCEVTPNLFISAATAARENKVRAIGIGVFWNVTRELPLVDYGRDVSVIKIDVEDTANEDLKSHFQVILDVLIVGLPVQCRVFDILLFDCRRIVLDFH
jgi:hypothetical protein